MFKYLAIVFVLSYGIPGNAVIRMCEIEQPKPKTNETKVSTNCSVAAEELSKKQAVSMSGQTNYHVGQQIFHVYGMEQFEKLFGNVMKKRDRKLESDYLVTEGIGAHKLHHRRNNWNKARRACIEEGGHLAVINSVSEEKILLRMMQEQKIGEAWLGLHDLYDEGDWVTVTDEAIENTGYSRWTTKFSNLPDNFGGAENCAVLVTEGGINDIGCKIMHPFFCEISV